MHSYNKIKVIFPFILWYGGGICKSFTMKIRTCNNQPTLMKIIPNITWFTSPGPPKMPSHAPLALSVQPDSLVLSWRSVELPSRITDYSPVTYRIEVRYWNYLCAFLSHLKSQRHEIRMWFLRGSSPLSPTPIFLPFLACRKGLLNIFFCLRHLLVTYAVVMCIIKYKYINIGPLYWSAEPEEKTTVLFFF